MSRDNMKPSEGWPMRISQGLQLALIILAIFMIADAKETVDAIAKSMPTSGLSIKQTCLLTLL